MFFKDTIKNLLGFAGISCVLVLISHSSTANKFLIPLEKASSSLRIKHNMS